MRVYHSLENERLYHAKDPQFIEISAEVTEQYSNFLLHRFISSPEPSLYDGSRPSVRASTLSNMNILKASEPIVIKFYQKHH